MALIFPQPDSDGGRSNFERGRLTMRDAEAIRREIAGVSDIAPQLRTNIDMVTAGNTASTNAVGADTGYERVAGVGISEGRGLSEADVRTAARVIILGPTVATRLFGDYDPVGETIRVNRIPFTIIGVLEAKGSSFGNDNDDVAVIPITTARQRFIGDTLAGPDDLHVLFVGFQDGVNLSDAKEDMTGLLRKRYHVQDKDTSPFTIRTTEEFIEQTSQVTGIFQTVLVAIASISLLVGGIGIMNIMLVSVTERTREIGLRMALGAKKSDIRNQFLVEARGAVRDRRGDGAGAGGRGRHRADGLCRFPGADRHGRGHRRDHILGAGRARLWRLACRARVAAVADRGAQERIAPPFAPGLSGPCGAMCARVHTMCSHLAQNRLSKRLRVARAAPPPVRRASS